MNFGDKIALLLVTVIGPLVAYMVESWFVWAMFAIVALLVAIGASVDDLTKQAQRYRQDDLP